MAHQQEERDTGGGGNLAAGPASGMPPTGGQLQAKPAGGRTDLAAGAEFDLIRRFLKDATADSDDVLIGPGDDAAVLKPGGIVLSTDLSSENVHFRREWMTSFDIGYRAAAASLSDLAAMAAAPVGVLASLGVPAADAGAFAVGVMSGVRAAVEAAGGTLLGGDLTSSPGAVFLDIVSVGRTDAPVRRRGAMPGDEIWVTGTLGAAAIVVDALLRGVEADPAAMTRFLAPIPRVREAMWLAERGVPVAMLDISDGLGGDAGHLAAASGVAVILNSEAIPIDASVSAAVDPEAALRYALSGGEDYELCFAARPGTVSPLVAEFRDSSGCELTQVGHVEAGTGVFLETEGRRVPLVAGGFQHFGRAR